LSLANICEKISLPLTIFLFTFSPLALQPLTVFARKKVKRIIDKQEVKESFASPDYLFYGKSHIIKQLYHKNGCKKPFCLPSIPLPEAMDQSGTRSD